VPFYKKSTGSLGYYGLTHKPWFGEEFKIITLKDASCTVWLHNPSQINGDNGTVQGVKLAEVPE